LREVDSDELDLAEVLRPGDRIAWGQACAEPVQLLRTLAAQAHGLPPVSAFCGLTYSPELVSEIARKIPIASYGMLGRLRELEDQVRVVPCHFSALSALLTRGRLRCDVVFVQVSSCDDSGGHSLGMGADYIYDVAVAARTVIAEINHRVPRTHGASLPAERIDLAIHTSLEPMWASASEPSTIDQHIAANVAGLVADGDCIQLGVGGVADAVAAALTGHRNLGFHSGMISDAVVNLVDCGALDGSRKRRDSGLVVAGAALGSKRLAEFLDDNQRVRLLPVSYTHRQDVLRELGPLVSINSALEVDLTGQVGAEQIRDRRIGAVGGQVDFMRGAVASGGRAVTALPARGIVARLHGPVTTARSDVDYVVTEHGCVALRGLDLDDRRHALAAIARPEDRDALMTGPRP
jgi:acyl-CoA hydrolase